MDSRALEYEALVQFKLLHEGGVLPQRGTPFSGAYDIFAPTDGSVAPGDTQMYGLGICHQICNDNLMAYSIKATAPDGTYRFIDVPFRLQGLLIPRSGLAAKQLIRFFFAPCLIDHDYRGQIHVMIENGSKFNFFWKKGDRICQIMYVPAYMGPIMEVQDLTPTERGEGGFGSTGA